MALHEDMETFHGFTYMLTIKSLKQDYFPLNYRTTGLCVDLSVHTAVNSRYSINAGLIDKISRKVQRRVKEIL